MKIGMIAPPWFSVPPTGYGGTENVVSYLTEGLVARGHEPLFASGGSRTAARLVTTFTEPPSRMLGDPIIEVHHVVNAYDSCSDFDIIHDHTMVGLLASSRLRIPAVHTLHGPITQPVYGLLAGLGGRVHFISISANQRSNLPQATSSTVIHNGIVLDPYRFNEHPRDNLLFFGRMSPEKGIIDAIEIAKRSRRPLLILARANEPPEIEYLQNQVIPALRGLDAEIRNQVTTEEKVKAFGDAFATLFPIHWAEPFGLVMIESMATGTPVIAYPNGAAPEVVEHGGTGFLCEDIASAVDAVDRIPDLLRRDCRTHVEANFSADRAVERHEALYRTLVSR